MNFCLFYENDIPQKILENCEFAKLPKGNFCEILKLLNSANHVLVIPINTLFNVIQKYDNR